MAKPTSKEDLIDYCLRALGAPVIEINVALEQLDDRYDQALQWWREYNDDATFRDFRKHEITQADIDNGYLTIPDDMLTVLRVLPYSGSQSGDKFSAEWQYTAASMADLNTCGTGGGGTMLPYYIAQQHLANMQMMFPDAQQGIRFNRHMNRLIIDMDWSAAKVGEFFVVEGYSVVDPDTFTDVYDDVWLKEYLTALIKQQWGTNLKKFEGLQMPGGVTLDGRALYEEATAELGELKDRIRDESESLAMFFVG